MWREAACVLYLPSPHALPTLPRKQSSEDHYAATASIQPKHSVPGEKYMLFELKNQSRRTLCVSEVRTAITGSLISSVFLFV